MRTQKRVKPARKTRTTLSGNRGQCDTNFFNDKRGIYKLHAIIIIKFEYFPSISII